MWQLRVLAEAHGIRLPPQAKVGENSAIRIKIHELTIHGRSIMTNNLMTRSSPYGVALQTGDGIYLLSIIKYQRDGDGRLRLRPEMQALTAITKVVARIGFTQSLFGNLSQNCIFVSHLPG